MSHELHTEMTLPPPDKQEIELEVAGLFRNGDIKAIARYVQRDAGMVSKMLSANCGDKNNVVYFGLLFIWAFDQVRRDLGDRVVEIILRERAKWLDEAPQVLSDADLTEQIGIEFSEYVACRMRGKDMDTQIKEAGDIEAAAAKLKANLIRERNAQLYPARSIAAAAVSSRRNRVVGANGNGK